MRAIPTFLALILALGGHAPAQSPNLVVGDVDAVSNMNPVNGIDALAVGTTVCNIGTAAETWQAENPNHPVIVQNLYRMWNGRFEQIGRSDAHHGFLGVGGSFCGTCSGSSATTLGLNCSNTISSIILGFQERMGPRGEIDPTTGLFIYPPSDFGNAANAVDKRLQVPVVELDGTTYPGATHYVESIVVGAGDAGGVTADNAGWRRVEATGGPNNYNFASQPFSGAQQSALAAWKLLTPEVQIFPIVTADGGRFNIAFLGTDLGADGFGYEICIQNLSSRRGASRVSVQIPSGAGVSEIEFHDPPALNTGGFDTSDWSATVSTTQVSWSTTDFATDSNANALRWGDAYNFRFVTDTPPFGTPILIEVEFFGPGAGPGSGIVSFQPQGSLHVTAGEGATGNIGESFLQAIEIELLDTFNAPILGVPIQFSQTAGTGSVSFPAGGVAVTDAQGRASINVIGGTLPGPATITADSGDLQVTIDVFVRRLNRIWVSGPGALILQIQVEPDWVGTPVTIGFDDSTLPPAMLSFGVFCTSILSPLPSFVGLTGDPGLPFNFRSNLVVNANGVVSFVQIGLTALTGTNLSLNHQAYALRFVGGVPDIFVSNCITGIYN